MQALRVLAGGAAIAVLLVAAPSPLESLGLLTAGPVAGDPTAPVLAVAALAAWVLATWLLVVALLTVGERAGGALGAACRRVLPGVAPAVVRRGVALSLGLGVVLGGTGAASAATPGDPVRSQVTAVATAASGGADLDWPLPGGGQPAAPTPATPAAPSRAATVVVRPGDTLWGLARQHLPAPTTDAQVAVAWPSWWSANRAVIGDDPDLLRPGQQLDVPPADPPPAEPRIPSHPTRS